MFVEVVGFAFGIESGDNKRRSVVMAVPIEAREAVRVALLP